MANTQETKELPEGDKPGEGKKQILLNAFDMSTIGHLSPGQWKVCCNEFKFNLVRQAYY